MTMATKKVSFKRIGKHECQRCGLCCQGRGDFAFDFDDIGGEFEPFNCTALGWDDNKKAVCRMQDCKRDCCEEYPWDEWCQREMVEMGIWEAYKI